MHILIFNCGSSSQSFKVYRASGEQPTGEAVASGKAHSVATQTQAEARLDWQIGEQSGSRGMELPSHRAAAEQILALLEQQHIPVDAVGHRFVHGGTLFDHTMKIDPPALERLQQCLHFAPIHNPNSYSVIEVCLQRLPGVPQYAVFDTAFHAGMPEAARQYALPKDLRLQYGFRKYGFHGLSYQYVSAQAARLMGQPLARLKLILCHLGTGGSSVVAVQDGKSLDTSMGYSPLPGLVMSTRCGDIDPEVVLELVRITRSPEAASRILNQQSGLIGLSGVSSNLQEVIAAAEQGDADCALAYAVYVHRLRFYLGAFTWLLDGADLIAFTDDIGVKSWQLREEACGGVERLGVRLDRQANRTAPEDRATRISAAGSRTQVWVIPTDEESVILREVLACVV